MLTTAPSIRLLVTPPHFLMFGRCLRLPIDAALGTNLSKGEVQPYTEPTQRT